MGCDEKAVFSHAKELKKLSGRKEIAQAGLDVTNSMLEASSDLSYSEIVNIADSKFNNKINSFEVGGLKQPVDIFSDLEAEIENSSDDLKTNEILCPYKRMQKLYGDFIPGELYVWAARPKASKSTFLMNLALQCSTNLDQNVQLL